MAKKGSRIILDEKLEVEKILSFPTLNIDYKKIFKIAKYYYEEGLNTRQVEEKILEYCNKSDVFNIYFFRDMIDRILKDAKSYHLRRSNQNIAITKKEIDVLKKLPHKIYRIALYILFISKFEKYQILSKKKLNNKRGFKTYFNYSLESALYSVQELKGGANRLSKKEEIEIGRVLTKAGIIKMIFSIKSAWEVIISDFESKDVEFAIVSNLDFDSQIKYYCVKCGNECKKSKKHDFCENCFSEDLRKRKAESVRKTRRL